MLEKVDPDIIDLINRVLTSLGDTSKAGLEEITKIHYADGIGAILTALVFILLGTVAAITSKVVNFNDNSDKMVMVGVAVLLVCGGFFIVGANMDKLIAPEGLAVRELIQLCR